MLSGVAVHIELGQAAYNPAIAALVISGLETPIRAAPQAPWFNGSICRKWVWCEMFGARTRAIEIGAAPVRFDTVVEWRGRIEYEPFLQHNASFDPEYTISLVTAGEGSMHIIPKTPLWASKVTRHPSCRDRMPPPGNA